MLILSLLTIVIISVIFLAAFMRLWKTPPSINIKLEGISVQVQPISPPPEPEGTEEPLPIEIVSYIDGESDEWARVARRKRARMLKRELGDWDAAFRSLQQEDNPYSE